MSYQPANPLIIQSDRTLFLEVDNPRATEARDVLMGFAELVKSPEHIHTYRLTPLSLWNASSAGLSADDIMTGLRRFSKFPVPQNVEQEILDMASRYGQVRLLRQNDELVLAIANRRLMQQLAEHRKVAPYLGARLGPDLAAVQPWARGRLKKALVELGWPVEDLAGFSQGAPLPVALRTTAISGGLFSLREYQQEAVDRFYMGGAATGGNGVIVLPCGAGKTVVGLGAIVAAGTHTLVLTTSTTAVRQWIRELLDKSTLAESEVGEYTGAVKDLKPVTVTTYQMLVHKRRGSQELHHLALIDRAEWGLIIYDEVHLLPAQVFQITAELQSKRRLGLTATLVREDGKEEEVFSLIGPKRYDVPWRVLEQQGWVAPATCVEVRVDLPEPLQDAYAGADDRDRYRIAACSPSKIPVVAELVRRHEGELVLVIGQYLDQLEEVARRLGAPLITGEVPERERERLYADFRAGRISILVVSKVANYAIDLPDASVAIQISGTFGSRQEEAQRLGRILRPKRDGRQATFYAVVTRETRDQEFAMNRQLFLVEQGYQYRIIQARDGLEHEWTDQLKEAAD